MLEKLSLSYNLHIFQSLALDRDVHCVKSVRFGAFFWSVFSRIQSECGKIRTRKTPNTDNIHAVCNTFEDLHQGQNEEKFYKILST